VTVSNEIAVILFLCALLWPIAVFTFWMMVKLPTRSLLQQITRPSAREESEDLLQMTENVRRRLAQTLRLWPIALLVFLAAVILFAVR
jgi:hypothetical protein